VPGKEEVEHQRRQNSGGGEDTMDEEGCPLEEEELGGVGAAVVW
jgi:hypothetical protein